MRVLHYAFTPWQCIDCETIRMEFDCTQCIELNCQRIRTRWRYVPVDWQSSMGERGHRGRGRVLGLRGKGEDRERERERAGSGTSTWSRCRSCSAGKCGVQSSECLIIAFPVIVVRFDCCVVRRVCMICTHLVTGSPC